MIGGTLPIYFLSCGCTHPNGSEEVLETYEYCPECVGPGEDEYDEEYGSGYNRGSAERAANLASSMSSTLPDMRVPQVAREVSCEWEGSAGVRAAHYACSLLVSGGNGAHAEYHGDGTCDGEVVFGRLQLWDDQNADAYARSVTAIELLRETDSIRVGFNAGHHIHISAREHGTYRGLSPNNLVSLYSVFAHCEDLLYRFAAAGWTKHRTEGGGGYSEPMPKLGRSQSRTARNVGNAIGRDRYQGLNITPYLESISRCHCGAYRFGEWESCECNDDRMTVEWRLWNAAISPRKIRAYIAISSVLTDYAANVDVRDVTGLDEHPFQGTGTVDEDSLLTQLDYLTTRPGFTARDRKDLYWLASISPGMGELGREYESSRGTTSVDDLATAVG